MIIYYLIAFIFGLCWGSFLNVCIYRIPRRESIVFPGSHCPICNHPLAFYDNIPLFSYIFLAGKCRYCKSSISIQYPIIETLVGLLTSLLLFKFGISLSFLAYFVFILFLLSASLIDLLTFVKPYLTAEGLENLIKRLRENKETIQDIGDLKAYLRMVSEHLSEEDKGLLRACWQINDLYQYAEDLTKHIKENRQAVLELFDEDAIEIWLRYAHFKFHRAVITETEKTEKTEKIEKTEEINYNQEEINYFKSLKVHNYNLMDWPLVRLLKQYAEEEKGIIPDIITLPGALLGIVFSFFIPLGIVNSLLGLLVGMSIPLIIRYLYLVFTGREALGLGDATLMAMIGAFLGWRMVILTLLWGSLIGTIISLPMLLTKKMHSKSILPYGPFLAAGALLVLFFGNSLTDWYINLILPK